MTRASLSFVLHGAIAIASSAWIAIGLLLWSIYVHNPGMIGPPFGNRIFVLLIPLPWSALIGFTLSAYTLQRRRQPEAAWAITVISLIAAILYGILLVVLLIPREL